MTPPRGLKRLALFSLAFTVAVVVWGGAVRATGSGAGCGSHWPSCNGELVPVDPSAKTLVEFSHRLSSGLSLLLVAVLYGWARRVLPRGDGLRRAAGWALGFMVSEALLGALLVKLELVADNASANRAVAMSLHLVNTFFLLAAQAIVAVRALAGDRPFRLTGSPLATAHGAALGLAVLTGISGAVAALGDTLVQQGVAHPVVEVLVRLRIAHPLLALLAAAAMAWCGVRALASGPAPVAGGVVVVLTAAQLALGLVNVILQAPVWMQLVHLFTADALWIALVTLTLLAEGHPQTAPGTPQATPATT